MSKLGDATELDALIAKIEALEHLGEHLAEVAAPAIEAVARAQWAAGKGPSNTVWAKTKDGGRTALTALTEKIKIVAAGNVVKMTGSTILDVHVRKRRAMPVDGSGLPRPWREAAEKALARKVAEIVR